ncbi:tRNA pseudouridine(55) synthase TruB [Aureispira anguillae]|uniref:tRNA pseudouridine synthase B n=1 Tax=Aureispira anguillae TaxID=2864201 RepID=A0A915YBD7_9BACT|nr:tRNA pseudouridine(55) synthase TruB [Aureispira anguillae]BDS09928.1 tRNA pseudouridine(55) synthase TruB [Aureispira anguillae]
MEPEQKYNFKEGATLLIDKPLEWTSFDVVNKVRYALKRALNVRKIKVGHAGTLDPLATGLLILCTGKFTKKIDTYQSLYKVYDGTMRLGATTPSFDAETEINEIFPLENISPKLIQDNIQHFVGEINQVPPMFSAIKVDGQPLYKKARKGQEVKIKSRKVTIHDFKIPEIRFPDLDFEVKCTKGTYIRSLAHEFGQKMNNGAYLTKLRRTQIGEYHLKDAWQLEDLIAHIRDNYTPEENA